MCIRVLQVEVAIIAQNHEFLAEMFTKEGNGNHYNQQDIMYTCFPESARQQGGACSSMGGNVPEESKNVHPNSR